MAATVVRFYLDENLPIEIAHQLRSRGIDCVTARDVGGLGDGDEVHLVRATDMGRVLCTYDYDFLRLAAAGIEHSGIVHAQQSVQYVGDWVRFLELVHAVYEVDEMRSRIEYL